MIYRLPRLAMEPPTIALQPLEYVGIDDDSFEIFVEYATNSNITWMYYSRFQDPKAVVGNIRSILLQHPKYIRIPHVREAFK